MKVETVKIKTKGGYTVINADDFDKDKMKKATNAEIKAADKKAADK